MTAFVAILLAAGAAGCGSDGDDTAAMHGAEPAPSHTETKAETKTPEAAEFERLDPAAFEKRMASEGVALINVHIPYEGELADTDAFIRYDKILGDSRLPADKGSEILLYCRSGRMSEEAGAELNKAGYTKVAHLEGGMKAWEASGRELIHDPAKAAESPAGGHS